MTGSTITERAYAELDGLRSRLPDLRQALTPGTRRRWTQRELTADQRARLDARARQERHAKEVMLSRGLAVIGGASAPIRLDVLDVETSICEGVAVLEVEVCQALGLTPLPDANTGQRITRLIGLLDRIAEDEGLIGYVLDEGRRLGRRAAAVLGDVEPMPRLDARCPVCDAKSLRMLADQEVIICANPGCRCGDESCPCGRERSRRPHTWDRDAWPWLAQVVA